jgi:hypothetical protein
MYAVTQDRSDVLAAWGVISVVLMVRYWWKSRKDKKGLSCCE